jgi:hypothetical protein
VPRHGCEHERVPSVFIRVAACRCEDEVLICVWLVSMSIVLMIVIRDNGGETTEEMRQKFITTRSGLREAAAWLQTQQGETVVMESTAQYWWPVWIELEGKFALHLVQAAPTQRLMAARPTLRMRGVSPDGFSRRICATALCRMPNSGAGAD